MLKADICIVGAGPGGLLLSYLLAKKNFSVILIEQHKTIAKAFRGEHLNEEGEEVLKKYGLYAEVQKLGLLKMETLEYWEDGKLLKTITPDPKVGHLGIHVPQAHLLSAIMNEAKKYPNFTFLPNTKMIDLLKDDINGRFTGILAIKNQKKLLIQSNLIIGADGRNSAVRKKAGIPTTIYKHGYDLLWAKIPAPQDWKPSIKMAQIDGYQLALFTQAKGFIQIGWNIEEGSYPKLRKQPFTLFIEKLIKAFPEIKENVRTHITSWSDFVFLNVYSNEVDTWYQNGVLLIGDAAHTMTPTGAFGLNSALKDADLLAGCISQKNINKLHLENCQSQRYKEIEHLQHLQIEKEKHFLEQFIIIE